MATSRLRKRYTVHLDADVNAPAPPIEQDYAA
jgi:hypothetical protein